MTMRVAMLSLLLVTSAHAYAGSGTEWRLVQLDAAISIGDPDNVWFEGTWMQPGRQRFSAGLRRTASERGAGGRTVFTQPGDSQLMLPADWVAAPTTDGMSGIDDTRAVRQRVLRERLDLAWSRRFGDNIGIDASMHHSRRRGLQVAGGTFGSTGGNARAVMLPAPLDDEATEWTLAATYATGAQILRAHWRLSSYDNAHTALRWQNPFTGVAGWGAGSGYPDGIGMLARAPDNRAHDVALAWAWRAPHGIALNLDLAQGNHRQDDPFLDYTSNPMLSVTQPLPRDALAGRLDWRRVQGRARWPVTPDLQLVLRVVDERREDRTPPALFIYVGGDALDQDPGTAGPRARIRLPRDVDRRRQTASLAWRASRRDRFTLEWKYLAETRPWSEVAETSEHTRALEWRRHGTTVAHLRLEDASRTGSDYRDNHPFLLQRTDAYIDTLDPDLRFENHPLLRRFNLADRDRRLIRGGITTSGGSWSLGLTAHHLDDDYSGSVFGLTDSRQRGVHADLGFNFGDRGHLSLWLAHERWVSVQDGRNFRGFMLASDIFDPDRDWRVRSRDRVDSGGIGWSRKDAWRGIDLDAGFTHTHMRVDVDVVTGPALTSAPLPTVRTRIDRATLGATRALSARWRARLGVEYDNWRTRDWAWDGVAAGTMANVLGLGESPPEHALRRVTLGFSLAL